MAGVAADQDLVNQIKYINSVAQLMHIIMIALIVPRQLILKLAQAVSNEDKLNGVNMYW